MKTVVFDESGNTGADLLNINQPVFVLASADYTTEEAIDLLSCFNINENSEAKFKNLKRKTSGQKNIISFMERILKNKNKVLTMAYHKEYAVVTYIVDLLIEEIAKRQGIDIYKRGYNIALANLHYYSLNTLCNKDLSKNLKKSFVKMIRESTRENIERFYYFCYQIHGTCIDRRYQNHLEPILISEQFIYEILNDLGGHSIDPAIPTFCTHCSTWGDRINDRFDIIHDHSKPLVKDIDLLKLLMDTEANYQQIGYDRRSYSFPFRVNNLSFSDSKEDPRLQLVDIIASCTAAWLKGSVDINSQDGFWQELNALELHDIAVGFVFPSPQITPEELGTDSDIGCNAVEYVANFVKHKKA